MLRSIRAIGIICEYVLYDYLIHFPYFAVRTLLSPAFYLFGFGLGVGALTQAGGDAYFNYIFLGVLMISVMQASYTHFSTEIWISRLYDKYLELLIMVAPAVHSPDPGRRRTQKWGTINAPAVCLGSSGNNSFHFRQGLSLQIGFLNKS